MAYDKVLRARAVFYREKYSQKETCEAFRISSSALKEWQKKYAETGSLENKPLERTWRKIDPAKLRVDIQAHTPATILTMQEHKGSAVVARQYGRHSKNSKSREKKELYLQGKV